MYHLVGDTKDRGKGEGRGGYFQDNRGEYVRYPVRDTKQGWIQKKRGRSELRLDWDRSYLEYCLRFEEETFTP